MEHLRYPNESTEYRAARNALLNDEIALRAQIEAVAAKRRALPPGGKVSEDYVSERIGKNAMPEKVTLSELFGSHDTLILYSFTYGPERELPCPGCTHLLDGIDGAARHMGRRAALHIVAKSSIARLAAWAHERGWTISRSCLRRVIISTFKRPQKPYEIIPLPKPLKGCSRCPKREALTGGLAGMTPFVASARAASKSSMGWRLAASSQIARLQREFPRLDPRRPQTVRIFHVTRVEWSTAAIHASAQRGEWRH